MTDSTKSPAKTGGHRESSDKMSSLAAKIMSKPDPFAGMKDWNAGTLALVHDLFDPWVQAARSLAGSVLSQDEHKGSRDEYQPSAGTSAYQMMADAEKANLDTTETLIHMIAATVLMKKVIGAASIGASVELSPTDLDTMHTHFEMSAKRDGMITVVRITPRDTTLDDTVPPLPPREAHLEAKPESLMLQDEPETPFEPQADAAVYDRPIWAVRYDGALVECEDRRHASEVCEKKERRGTPATVENRFCLHQQCPSEHCNLDRRTDPAPEVTSGG